jgi:hypothetical protein
LTFVDQEATARRLDEKIVLPRAMDAVEMVRAMH